MPYFRPFTSPIVDISTREKSKVRTRTSHDFQIGKNTQNTQNWAFRLVLVLTFDFSRVEMSTLREVNGLKLGIQLPKSGHFYMEKIES